MRITAKFAGKCAVCGKPIAPKTEIEYDPGPPKTAAHIGCQPEAGLFDQSKAEQIAERLGYKPTTGGLET